MLFVNSHRGDQSLGSALLAAPSFWLVVLTAGLAIWPWLLLRRVPIICEQPSSHAVILRLDHGVTPAIGTTRPISRNPFVGWHHFANVPAAPGASGYRMVVSRAGDWTSAFVDDPPSHVWVRGIPTMGVANVRKLFKQGRPRRHRQRHRAHAGSPARPLGAVAAGLGDEESRAAPTATS